MAKETKLTPAALKALEEELHYLKTVRELEVAQQLKEARAFGDLSENSEYDEAKNDQGKLFSREAEIEAILENYVLIEEIPDDGETVTMGSIITVEDDDELEDEHVHDFKIVGSQQADPMNGNISEESPFGKALLGHKVGETVVVSAPDGDITYKILSLRKSED